MAEDQDIKIKKSISSYSEYRDEVRETYQRNKDEPVEIPPEGFNNKMRWYFSKSGYSAIVAAAVVGPGTLAGMLKGGALFPWQLTWVIILSAIFCWAVAYSASRTTIATGLDPIETINKYVHPWIGFLVAIASVWVMVIVVMFQGSTVAASAWVVLGQAGGPPAAKWFGVIIIPLIAFAYVYRKSFNVVIWITRILLSILLIAYLAIVIFCFAKGSVPLGALLKGFIPTWPKGSSLLIAGILGGSCPFVIILAQGYNIIEGGKLRPKNFIHSNYDTLFHGFIVFGFFSIILFWAASAIYPPANLVPKNPIHGALTLAPLIGGFAPYLFSLGLWGAATTTLIASTFMILWPISTVFKLSPTIRNSRFAIIFFFTVCVVGITGPFLGRELFSFGIVAMATMNLFTLPVLIIWLYLCNSKKVIPRQELRAGWFVNLVFIPMIIIVGIATWFSAKGIWAFITK